MKITLKMFNNIAFIQLLDFTITVIIISIAYVLKFTSVYCTIFKHKFFNVLESFLFHSLLQVVSSRRPRLVSIVLILLLFMKLLSQNKTNNESSCLYQLNTLIN